MLIDGVGEPLSNKMSGTVLPDEEIVYARMVMNPFKNLVLICAVMLLTMWALATIVTGTRIGTEAPGDAVPGTWFSVLFVVMFMILVAAYAVLPNTEVILTRTRMLLGRISPVRKKVQSLPLESLAGVGQDARINLFLLPAGVFPVAGAILAFSAGVHLPGIFMLAAVAVLAGVFWRRACIVIHRADNGNGVRIPVPRMKAADIFSDLAAHINAGQAEDQADSRFDLAAEPETCRGDDGRLGSLRSLLSKGLISEEEYREKRRRIIEAA